MDKHLRIVRHDLTLLYECYFWFHVMTGDVVEILEFDEPNMKLKIKHQNSGNEEAVTEEYMRTTYCSNEYGEE